MSNGRDAIELIKDHYEAGEDSFGRAIEIRDWLSDVHGIVAAAQTVRAWDRQARLERHDAGQAVTNPTAGNSWQRTPDPSRGERIAARAPRLKDTATRVRNDRREAQADAAQPDAGSVERLRATMLEAAQDLTDAVAEDAGDAADDAVGSAAD